MFAISLLELSDSLYQANTFWTTVEHDLYSKEFSSARDSSATLVQKLTRGNMNWSTSYVIEREFIF